MFERFSEAARLAMFGARLEVTEAAGDAIQPKHLLLGLLEAKGGVAEALAGAAGLKAADIRPRLLSAVPTPLPPSIEVPFAPAARAALQAAVAEADAMACAEITTGHLLLGLMRDEYPPISILLQEAGLELTRCVRRCRRRPQRAQRPRPLPSKTSSRSGFADWVSCRPSSGGIASRGETVPVKAQASPVTIRAPTYKYQRDVF